jgi:hypothetical protein
MLLMLWFSKDIPAVAGTMLLMLWFSKDMPAVVVVQLPNKTTLISC